MAKLVIAFLFAFIALATTHTTTIITTSTDSNPAIFDWPFGSQECHIQQPVNQCRRYVERQLYSSPRSLLRGIGSRQGQQECCRALQNLNRECQCKAIEKLAWEIQRQQHGGGGSQKGQFGGQQEQSWGGDQGQFGGQQEQRWGGDQEGQFGGQQKQVTGCRQKMEIARRVIENLPDECNLDVQQCNIPYY